MIENKVTAPVYNEIRNHQEELSRAEAGVADLASQRNNRWYPRYHIASNGGWINDPNGLCYYQGRWHVFYQLHPYGVQWGPMHWGHVSSSDMVTWQREAIFMAPNLEEEKDGVFSGSAVVDDAGNLRFYYTGHRWVNGHDGSDGEWQVQMCALAKDTSVQKAEKVGMVVDCPREAVDSHFRDPKVWKMGDTWYMIFGVSSRERRGQIWLYTSSNMEKWTFARVLFEHPDPQIWMLECPDFFPITDRDGSEKWVLGFSAMGTEPEGFTNRNKVNAGYVVGTWQPGEAFQAETDFRLWDRGHNFYAPQSFTAPDGRQLMYGWLSPFAQPIAMESEGWCGNLTLPREITLDAGVLSTPPSREVTGYREETLDFGACTLAGREIRELLADETGVEIELEIDLDASTAERAGLKVHATASGGYTYIAYDQQTQAVVLDRQNIDHGDRGYRAAPLDPQERQGKLKLRVFVDRGCIEVYVNEGRHALSSYSFPGDGPRAVKLESESGELKVTELKVHKLGSNGLE